MELKVLIITLLSYFIVDPKKQIYISRLDINNLKMINKSGEEVSATAGQLKNLRKKDYYENRVKKGFQSPRK